MRIDMRDQPNIRGDVRTGLMALRVQARQIWGPSNHTFSQIVTRLMVGVGDLARLARDNGGFSLPMESTHGAVATGVNNELKKELGNIIFSTIRWVDDLGLDVLECLDLAIEAQEKFAKSGRPR
jgi:hypothetical protein